MKYSMSMFASSADYWKARADAAEAAEAKLTQAIELLKEALPDLCMPLVDFLDEPTVRGRVLAFLKAQGEGDE